MNKTLVMNFQDEKGKKVSLSLTEIKDNLTEDEIGTLMDALLENKDVFDVKDPLVKKVSGNIVERTVTEAYKA